MSIAIMGEGDMMGRGIPPDPKIQARIALARRTPDQVIIFGAGPAGMLAAHACVLAGHEPVLVSAPDTLLGLTDHVPVKSRIGGATYLHSAIPDVTRPEPDAMVRFTKVGTARVYALKVYGDPNHRTSWEKFRSEHPGWALQPVYDDLWRRYSDRIIPMTVNHEVVKDFLTSHPMVISTIPPSSYCLNPEHRFPSKPIWTLDHSMPEVDENEIVYDGRLSCAYYRSSKLFGFGSTEMTTNVMGVARKGYKVMETDCDCFPDMMRVGRFGKWKPGVLVNHAFQEVWDAMWNNFEGT